MKRTYLIFFLIISIVSQTSQKGIRAVVPEDEFVLLKSREIVQFQLNKTNNEIYYSFQNNFDESDIVISLKVGKGFTTYCYIYDSYDNIKINSKGEYVNPIKEVELSENYIILKSSELEIKKTKYYFIIKDIFNSYNKDYISIFNEQDEINLVKEKFVIMEKFYSKNKYYFSFSHTKNEIVTLDLNINDTDFYQDVYIYKSPNKELIYKGEKNKGEIKLNEDRDSEGDYIIEIESQEKPYIDIKSSIILHKDEVFVKELKYGSPLTFAYTGNKLFNLYVDLNEYNLNDENIITFKFGNQIFDRNLLSHCYAKVLNFESYDDSKFLSNMPAKEEENEAVFSRLSGSSNIYQLYFKNTKQKEENKKPFLLIHLSIQKEEHDTDEYISPEEFSIYLSKKPITINLGEYKNKKMIIDENIKLEDYICQIYKIILPEIEDDSNKLSYIFFSSINIEVVYNYSMLVNDHLKDQTKMIHVLSSDESEYNFTKILYVKLFGFSNEKVNFKIESTEYLVNYIFKDSRSTKTYNNKLTDCSKPFYYIGEYSLNAKMGYFYLETFYGKINTYYKIIISPGDSILINENPKYLIEDNLIKFESSLDIVEFKCEIPGLFQIHFIDDTDSDNRQINLLSKVYTFLPRMTDFTITPIINYPQEDVSFEIYTPTGAEIEINDGSKITYIDSNNKYYQVKYKNESEVPYLFTVFSKKDTVISISLTNKNNFAIVDSDYSRIGENYSQVIVKLLQKENCENINLEINKVYYGYNYSFFKGNVEYAANLVESESDYIEIDRSYKIKMIIPNPYLREEIYDENIAYYFMFYIEDYEKIQKEVFVTYNEIKEYEIINKDVPMIIFKDNEKYQLPKFEGNMTDMNIIYQSCGNLLKQINIYNYEDQIKTIINNENESIYQHDSIKIYHELSNLTYRLDINLDEKQKDINPFLNGAVIGITEENITDEDIEKYSNLTLNISQNGRRVEWDPIENISHYDVYVLNENNTYVPFLKNPCLLQSIKNHYPPHKVYDNEDYYEKYYSSSTNYITLNEKGRYYVTVSANISGQVPLIYIYDKVIFDSSLIPEDSEESLDNGTKIFMGISIPLVFISVFIILIALTKCNKNPIIDPESSKSSLVRDTEQSSV